MLTGPYEFGTEIIQGIIMREMTQEKISQAFKEYMSQYKDVYNNKTHAARTEQYVSGLMSGTERKSMEPMAMTIGSEHDVRGMQNFISRSTFDTEKMKRRYQELATETLNDVDGMISVDESDFIKKGNKSPGVARQYCGRLGKRENCQAGVFTAYASKNGHALMDERLYIPKKWLEESEEYEKRRKEAKIPENLTFQTKNEMAKEMINLLVTQTNIKAKWIGCDASFGSDHGFLESLPVGLLYFASVRKNEHIFLSMPEMILPESKRVGGRYKRLRPSFEPVTVETVMLDDGVPWQRTRLADSAKGPIYADIKCTRCVSTSASYSGKSGKVRMIVPAQEVWLYIRRHVDGTCKYYLSNAPADIDRHELDRASVMRWPIEQCFEECKQHFGMADYESRTYCAWERHMLFVMMAHFFATSLRLSLKKRCVS